jgi:MFS family permease
MKGKWAYGGRRPEGIVAALSRYFHRLLRLLANDHAVRPHADGDKRLSRRGRDGGPVRSLVLGILLAIYPLGQFLGSPVLGALSDRYGRKPVLTVSLCIAVAAYVLISLGIELRSLALIAIGCLIGGSPNLNIASSGEK